jgi:hypothetical protein
MNLRLPIIKSLNLLSNEIINPKGKLFFGSEIGLNTITSIHPNHTNSLQG